MKNKKIGFWKWLYEKAKDGYQDFVIMGSILGGLVLAVLSLCFGIKMPILLAGIPIGMLICLHGFYKIHEIESDSE